MFLAVDGSEIPEQKDAQGSLGMELRHSAADPGRGSREPTMKTCCCLLSLADDFVVIVKGTKAHAEAIREEYRAFLEEELKLTLNMEKTHITHVNDGFVFLGHRIIHKRGSNGRLTVVTMISKEKAKAFARKLSKALPAIMMSPWP